MPASESYLVVGGCGFLGRYIVELLMERGEPNIAVFDIVQRHFDSNVTFFIGDLTKEEDINHALQKSGATAVFHVAAPSHHASKEIQETVNVTGTRTLLDCCKDIPTVKKFVYTSSASVAYSGVLDNVNVDERVDYPTTAMDFYTLTKEKGEKMVLAANSSELMTCAIRPSQVFGPGDRQAIQGYYNVVLNGQTKYQIGNNNNLCDCTYVLNVAHAHILAMDKLGTVYPYHKFRDPISYINLSIDQGSGYGKINGGKRKIPTSNAHPLGPNTSPTESDLLAANKFEKGEEDEEDQRPVLRNKLDQFSEEASIGEDDEHFENPDNSKGIPIAGQTYFITNGEPVYFWDFARTIWKELGHVPPSVWILPTVIGLLFAQLAEMFSKIVGKEPGFTKFRVNLATQQRYYDMEKARRMLGYDPIIGVDQGMKLWTAWYRGELEKQKLVTETEKTK